MKATFISLIACFAVATPLLAREDETALNLTNGFASQKYLGTGKGVIVSVLDAGIDVTHPAIRGSIYAQRDFTGQKILDDSENPDDAGHGTGIAGILLGHNGHTYTGLAPGARLINARVDTTADITNDLWAGSGLTWSARKGAKVVNISLGNKIGGGELTDKLNLISDYVAERYGVSVVVAAGNEHDTAVRQTPGGSYNGLTVGALGGPDYTRVWKNSNKAIGSDARTKPDLVAPGENIHVATSDWEKDTDYWPDTGTSFAAPMVGGVAAQVIGYGRAHSMPTDPLLVKAVLLSSARHVKDVNGSGWSWRDGAPDPDHRYLIDQPLDDQQGAGAVDALAAYDLYAKRRTRSSPLNIWREGKLKGNQVYDLKLGSLKAGQTLSTTLTWYRHVGYKDKNDNGPDGADTYYQTAPLADFTLELLRDGVPVAMSDSDVDNLEHLSWTLERNGHYTLEVYRFAEGGIASEPFALAAQVMAAQTAALRRSIGLDGGEAAAFAAVPEPSTALLAFVGMILRTARRRRA